MLAIIERCIGEHTGNNINSKTQQAKPASARESLPSNYWLRWRCNWTQSSQSDNFQLARFHVRLPNTNSGEKTKGSKHCQKCNLTIPQAPSLLQIQKLSSDQVVVMKIFLGDGLWHGLKAIETSFVVPSSPLNKKVFFFIFFKLQTILTNWWVYSIMEDDNIQIQYCYGFQGHTSSSSSNMTDWSNDGTAGLTFGLQ